MKILVVDNSSMIRMLIHCAIRVADWQDVEVVEAGDGLQGLAAVEQHGRTIDLILCDMNVPNMNGLSFLRSLRSSPEFRQIPFVIMTAEGSGVSVERAIREGAAGVVDKPFRLDAMVDLVRRHRASLRDRVRACSRAETGRKAKPLVTAIRRDGHR